MRTGAWAGAPTDILPQFRIAYYKLQLGMQPKQQWQGLIELLPTSPEDPTSRALHRTEHFERIVKAAKLAHEECGATDWFRLLRRNYADLWQRNRTSEDRTFRVPDLRETQLLLGGYIEEPSANRENGPLVTGDFDAGRERLTLRPFHTRWPAFVPKSGSGEDPATMLPRPDGVRIEPSPDGAVADASPLTTAWRPQPREGAWRRRA